MGAISRLLEKRLMVDNLFVLFELFQEVFASYMEVFLPHIELIEYFKDFCNLMYDSNAPDTYKSYSDGVNNILKLIKLRLVDLEEKVARQEDSMTLIKLEAEIRDVLKPFDMLKRIHKKIIIDTNENTSLFCATNLLVKLHENLLHSYTKQHQDLCLTLYIDSIYKYLWIIENWLTQDNFQDRFNEFPIVK